MWSGVCVECYSFPAPLSWPLPAPDSSTSGSSCTCTSATHTKQVIDSLITDVVLTAALIAAAANDKYKQETASRVCLVLVVANAVCIEQPRISLVAPSGVFMQAQL